jgi:hypothetical protein
MTVVSNPSQPISCAKRAIQAELMKLIPSQEMYTAPPKTKEMMCE